MSDKGRMQVNGTNASWSCCSRHDPTSRGRFRGQDKANARREIEEQLEAEEE